MLKIRPIEPMEIPTLKDFAPPDWSSDLSIVFAFHFGQPYFHPIVAELDGKLVGCAQGILTGKSGWLGNIIVLPEYRGRGIGTGLLRTVEADLPTPVVRLNVRASNQTAIQLYLHLGYHRVGTWSAYYQDHEDALIMEKQL
jgi:ribosomal protein S18 acetylase RimI-like enzyme